MSFDPPEDNEAWAVDEGFQYELWTDADRTLALAYGAASSAGQSYAARVTVLLDAEGDLVLEYQVSDFGTHPAQVLEDIHALQAAGEL